MDGALPFELRSAPGDAMDSVCQVAVVATI